jgi:hypothetical protein
VVADVVFWRSLKAREPFALRAGQAVDNHQRAMEAKAARSFAIARIRRSDGLGLYQEDASDCRRVDLAK